MVRVSNSQALASRALTACAALAVIAASGEAVAQSSSKRPGTVTPSPQPGGAVQGSSTQACELENAPPAFDWHGERVVPIDIERIGMRAVIRPHIQRITVTATVTFETACPGRPMFLMGPIPFEATMKGALVDTVQVLPRDSAGQPIRGVQPVRVVDQVLAAGEHELVVRYVPTHGVRFEGPSVNWQLTMRDVVGCPGEDCRFWGAQFLDAHGPANFEFDSFTLDLRVELFSALKGGHIVFSNGEGRRPAAAINRTGNPAVWNVTFPKGFNSSSFYFHLVPSKDYIIESCTDEGLRVDVYCRRTASGRCASFKICREALEMTKRVEAMMMGPRNAAQRRYPHGGRLLVHAVTRTVDRFGMEYSGAIEIAIPAQRTPHWGRVLRHEVVHQWFGRSLRPRHGIDGWIDEAIATLLEDDSLPEPKLFPPDRLATGSPYARFTRSSAYRTGFNLLLNLRPYLITANSDLLPFVRSLYQRDGFISVQDLRTALRSRLSQSEQADKTAVECLFQRYVYGDPDATSCGPARVAP